jgi:acyl-homoserine-lactone acylase
MNNFPRTLFFFLCIVFPAFLYAQPFSANEIGQWKAQAKRTTITRDIYGVPHIYGKTDSDAVFGLLFAQCEDDFPRVELNYITATGRLAEINGEDDLYADLVTRLLSDTIVAIERYNKSPEDFKILFNAFADGINYFLATHPEVKPKLITRFKPWMPLLFPEGSIGGNRSAISIDRLKAFYAGQPSPTGSRTLDDADHSKGSNGWAIGASRTKSKNPILLINPHTSFYFRSEVHMKSDEGLNVYGAVTWGQFFVYQGFNENCGWMHTTSQADAIDEYAEKIEKSGKNIFYEYDGKLLPVTSKSIQIRYKTSEGIKTREFMGYRTHHGPVVGEENGRWVTFKMLDDPLAAIRQSYMRTKSKDITDFEKWMELKTNTSNGTTFVDKKKNIAYWHGNFVPRRDPKFDWSKPVDGTTTATEWKGLHDTKDLVQIINPSNGWIQNCNSTPFTGAGDKSPKKENFPSYMAPDAETGRAINAVRLLSKESKFTLDKVIASAYDTYLSTFEALLPPLFEAYDKSNDEKTRAEIAEPIAMLKSWNKRSSISSVETTVAINWVSMLRRGNRFSNEDLITKTTPEQKLNELALTVAMMKDVFGTWKVKWGDVNRYQRLTGAIKESYDDNKPSIPVGLASGAFGSLPSYSSQQFPGTNKRYGTVGNSFVCVVEFGPKVKAKSIVTGGQSSDPKSKHFTDQAEGFLTGKFKDVFYYDEDLSKNIEVKYHPGGLK